MLRNALVGASELSHSATGVVRYLAERTPLIRPRVPVCTTMYSLGYVIFHYDVRIDSTLRLNSELLLTKQRGTPPRLKPGRLSDLATPIDLTKLHPPRTSGAQRHSLTSKIRHAHLQLTIGKRREALAATTHPRKSIYLTPGMPAPQRAAPRQNPRR